MDTSPLPFFRAGLLVPAFGFTLFLASCGPDASHSAARAEIEGLKQRLELAGEDLARASSDAKSAQRSLEEARTTLSGREKELREKTETLQKKLDETTKAFEEYRQKYKVTFRSRAAGQKIGSLDAGGGVVYQDVQILNLTPGEMRISHSSGLATVALGELNATLRGRFLYDAEEAHAWLAEEERKKEAKEEEETRKELAAYQAARKSGAAQKAGRNSTTRARYVRALENLNASARRLRADHSGCPVHKRYQLASYASQAVKLKKLIASLPSGN